MMKQLSGLMVHLMRLNPDLKAQQQASGGQVVAMPFGAAAPVASQFYQAKPVCCKS